MKSKIAKQGARQPFGHKEDGLLDQNPASARRPFPLDPTLPQGRRIGEEQLRPLLEDYIKAVEAMLKKYPEQWFNYYAFWEK